MGCVYLLTSPITKSYIGFTREDLSKRLIRHENHAKCDRGQAIGKAINHFGLENFVAKVLLISDDIHYLRFMENAAIKAYGTAYPNGYNLTTGESGVNYFVKSSQAKLKNSLETAWSKVEKSDRIKRTERSVQAMQLTIENDDLNKKRSNKISVTMRDGRVKGEKNGAAKLTDVDVLAIFSARNSSLSQTHIAKTYGVSRRLIGMIWDGSRWNHITGILKNET